MIAHFLADLQDDDHAELMWDERALAAVDGVTDERAQEFDPSLQVRTFMPALYGSSPTIIGGGATPTALGTSSTEPGPEAVR